MANDGLASITLGNDLIKPIIEAKINQAVLEAMKGQDHIIRNVVHQILNLKVDSSGNANTHYGKDLTFLAYLAQKCIKDAAEQAVREYIAQRQPEIKAQILAYMQQKSAHKKFAESVVTGVLDAANSKYNMTVKIELGQ